MKMHEFINNVLDFSSPIIIDYLENGVHMEISRNLSRKILLALYGDKEIVSIGADDDNIRLTIAVL